MEFARKHHPELAELLVQLKKGNASEYDRAIRELHQTSERLARIGEKTPDRYDFAIASWKLDSRIRLLSARMVMAESPALEAELKALLRERHDLRLAELKRERDRAAARLAKLDADIQSLEQNPDSVLQKELQTARRQLDAQASELKTKPNRKPGVDKKIPGNPSADEASSNGNPAKTQRVEKKPADSKAAIPPKPANATAPDGR